MLNDIYHFNGRYWVLTYQDLNKVKAYNYDDPFHQLELNYLQFLDLKKVVTIDDQVSLILHKYNAVSAYGTK